MSKNIMKVPDVLCLNCKVKGTCITDTEKIETREGVIIRPLICTRCRKHWKDFYGATNDDNPVISIQRNTSSNSSK